MSYKKKNKEIVILFPIHPTSYKTMITLAIGLKKNKIFEPYIILTESIINNISECHKLNIIAINSNTWVPYPTNNASKICNSTNQNRFLNIILSVLISTRKYLYRSIESLESVSSKKILNNSFWHLIKAALEIIDILVFSKRINKFLINKEIKACYIYNDSLGGIFSLFCKLCRQKGVKIISPPCAFQNPNTVAYRRSELKYLQYNNIGGLIINKYLKKYLPNQFYYFNSKYLLFYNPFEIIAWSILSILPENPWLVGANYTDITCVENYYIKNTRIESGINKDKIIVIPHTDTDIIWKNKFNKHKAQTFNNKKIKSNNKKTVLYSIPQLYQEGYISSWDKYILHLKSIISFLCSTNQFIQLVLHPKMDIKNYIFLEGLYSCKIFEGPTAKAVPTADIFISAGSSTNFWALMSGAIVIDTNKFYEESPNYYDYLESVFEVYDFKSFESILNNLINDPQYYSSVKQKVLYDQQKWFPPLDGKASEKILDLIES